MTEDDWLGLEVQFRLSSNHTPEFISNLILALRECEAVYPGFTAKFLNKEFNA